MPLACGPKHCPFLKHPTAACPRCVIHAGQKCPQFCGTGSCWVLSELCLELVPQKSRRTDLGNTAVETRHEQVDAARLHPVPDACRRLRTVATVQHGVSAMVPATSTVSRKRFRVYRRINARIFLLPMPAAAIFSITTCSSSSSHTKCL